METNATNAVNCIAVVVSVKFQSSRCSWKVTVKCQCYFIKSCCVVVTSIFSLFRFQAVLGMIACLFD